MAIDSEIIIDLRKYGLDDGTVIMGVPSTRAKLRYRNRVASTVAKVDAKNNVTADLTNLGDIQLESVLLYVRSAPFDSIDTLLDITDKIDEKFGMGRGIELIEEMEAAKTKIESGETSPTPSSPEAESENLG